MHFADLIASAVARPVGEAASFPYKLRVPAIHPADSRKHDTAKSFDGLLSGGAFAVLVLVCLTISALALLA